jgi:hydrogenase-4 component F
MLAMVVATMANSLGVLWVAMEGTTLATVFLIGVFRKREGLEAGWKYLILCSVGIALALFGTVLTYYSSVHVLGDESSALRVTTLLEVAGQLDPHVLKLAFIFLVVGYGTKVGLAPMHIWVPEAYSEAPAPVTAMLAGVLETVAAYSLLRNKAIMDQALPPDFTGNLLVLFGLISFVVAPLFILIQHDYKRLFAYSSVEHMGVAMVGFGVGGPLGTFGGLFHLLNHEVMVVSALATQSSSSDTLHLGQFLTIVIAHEVRSLTIVTLLLLFMVALFGGFTYRVVSMVWGTAPDGVKQGEKWDIGHVAMLVTVLALVGLGVALPAPMKALMDLAVDILTVR